MCVIQSTKIPPNSSCLPFKVDHPLSCVWSIPRFLFLTIAVMKRWYFKYSYNSKGHVGFFMFLLQRHTVLTQFALWLLVGKRCLPWLLECSFKWVCTSLQLLRSTDFFFQCGEKSKCKMGKKNLIKITLSFLVISGFTLSSLHIWLNRKCSSSGRRAHWSENKSCNGWE